MIKGQNGITCSTFDVNDILVCLFVGQFDVVGHLASMKSHSFDHSQPFFFFFGSEFIFVLKKNA